MQAERAICLWTNTILGAGATVTGVELEVALDPRRPGIESNDRGPAMPISPHNRYSYRFTLDRNVTGKWEVTDHEKNEVEELISDEEVWLADRLEVIEDTAARNHREVMRLKRILRDHNLIDETLAQP